MRKRVLLLIAAVLATALAVLAGIQPANAAAGFYISNGRILDANGNDFVMRGVNHPHKWYTSQTSSWANIKATGANTIRVVLSTGALWQKSTTTEITQVINLCKDNKLVCVLEVHDTTGYGSSSGAVTLSQAADYWVSVKSALQGQERYAIVNLGNEPYNSATDTAWVTQTKNAITKLRNAGISNALMADGPGWGQDPNLLMRNNASSIFNSDPQRNVIFSVHMYGVYGSSSTVSSYLNWFADNRLPLVVGEFGSQHSGVTVAVDTILATAQSRGIGWLAWSWSGNGGSDAVLDMTNNFNPNSLTTWGNRVVNGTNGLRATGRQASIYGTGSGTAPNGYPYCVKGSASDPDGDGWGWENNASCVVRGSAADH